MAIIMQALATEITEINDYDLFGEIRYGSNGYPDGTAEYDVGYSSNIDYQRIVWDNDILDGVNSGWRSVEFRARSATDGLTLSVNGGDDTAAYTPFAFSSIEQVKLRTAVTGQAGFLWQSLEFRFYDDGVLLETATRQEAGIDQSGDPNAGTGEEILTITPQQGTPDEVRIFGSVKLICPQGVYLEDNAVFSQVLVYTA